MSTLFFTDLPKNCKQLIFKGNSSFDCWGLIWEILKCKRDAAVFIGETVLKQFLDGFESLRCVAKHLSYTELMNSSSPEYGAEFPRTNGITL